jgi:hypothetical protein
MHKGYTLASNGQVFLTCITSYSFQYQSQRSNWILKRTWKRSESWGESLSPCRNDASVRQSVGGRVVAGRVGWTGLLLGGKIVGRIIEIRQVIRISGLFPSPFRPVPQLTSIPYGRCPYCSWWIEPRNWSPLNDACCWNSSTWPDCLCSVLSPRILFFLTFFPLWLTF